MMASIYMKLAGAGLILVLLGSLFLWSDHHGAARVQAKWDAAKVVQQAAVAKAQADNDLHAEIMRNSYNALNAHYEAILHEKVPAVADTVAAGVTSGIFRLRDNPVCPSSSNVTAATARSRAADAAATQALADRVANSITAVRVGDAADARERQLDAKVTALQGILIAERQKDTP
jgi:hypothetical protein